MTSRRAKLAKWFDECYMALSGLVLSTRYARFWVGFALSFVIFGTLINLLSGSTSAFKLFMATDFSGKIAILGDGFLANFGIGKSFFDFIYCFLITLLQSALIGLVVLVWHQKKANAQKIASADASDAGLVAGLAILGSGCPTCGTTLLAPVISTIASSSGYLLAGVISWGLTIAAVVLALFALKRIGLDAYVLILDERYRKKH